MADTVTEKSQGIEVGWEGTVDDAGRLANYLLFRAQKPSIVLRIACWIFSLTFVVLGIMLAQARVTSPVTWVIIIGFIGLPFAVVFGFRRATAWNAKRTVGTLGLRVFEAQPDFVRHTTPDMDIVVRWSQYPHIAIDGGDIYLIYQLPTDIRTVRIPWRAFGSQHAAQEAFGRLQSFHASARLGPGQGAATSNVWPPAPRVIRNPLPFTGPDLSPAYRAFAPVSSSAVRRAHWSVYPRLIARWLVSAALFVPILVIWLQVDFGLKPVLFCIGTVAFMMVVNAEAYRERLARIKGTYPIEFETDYEWLRIIEPHAVHAIRAGALRAVSTPGGNLYIETGPGVCTLVPAAVFQSPSDVVEIADRIRVAIRAEKGRHLEK